MNKLKYSYLILLVLMLCAGKVQAQNHNYADSVKKYNRLYELNKNDYTLALLYNVKSNYFRKNNADSALFYANLFLDIAKKYKNKDGEFLALSDKEFALRQLGNFAEALNIQLQILEASKQYNSLDGEAYESNSIGNTYLEMGDPRTGLNFYKRSYDLFRKIKGDDYYWTFNEVSNIGNAYEKLNMPDSALYYELSMYHNKNVPNDEMPELFNRIGNAYLAKGKYNDALNYYHRGLTLAKPISDGTDAAYIYFQTAKLFYRINNADSSIFYARKAFAAAKSLAIRGTILDATSLLADLYERKANIDSAYHYQQMAIRYNDTLFGAGKFNHIQKILSDEQRRDYQKSEDSIKYRLIFAEQKFQQQSLLAVQQRQKLLLNAQQLTLANRQKDIDRLKFLKTQAGLEAEKNLRLANAQQLKTAKKEQALEQTTLKLQKTEISSKRQQAYYLYAGIGGLMMLLIFIVRNYYNQRRLNKLLHDANERVIKTNHELAEQREEIVTQRDNLEQAYGELKSTQTQLIQREKMASLGELTAGIAHEIQNPLNFVNNFSEVSAELIGELKEELQRGDIEEATAIATDVEQNLEKIRHHGKRADAIVKGMLEHSRTNTGEKQLTDINVLCDEFLKLSYHGLRAKDKSFNAEMVTHFDTKLPKVNVSQQDMGRVMLNLFNNAFYAVNQKLKTAGAGYKPEVSVISNVERSSVVIKVKDNGVGIPDAIKEKIMQPFFTTKPTGEGTGLGLSLTYDMVVKGHGGNITVNSIAGEGSEFIISLPL